MGQFVSLRGGKIFQGAGTRGVVPDPGAETGKSLLDDGTWAVPAGGGDVVGPGASVDGNLPSFNGVGGDALQDTGITAVSMSAEVGHAASDGSSHADVVTNSAHVAGDGSDHADVATNSVHSAGNGSDHADVASNSAFRTSHGTHANKAALDLVSGTNTGDEATFAGPGTSGIVPDPTVGAGKFLKDNGTWDAPVIALGLSITTKTTTPIAVSNIQDVIFVELAAPGPVAVTLPQISAHDSKYVLIKDRTGDAGVNNITITPFAGDTIDGSATLVLSVDRGAVTLVGAGTDWSIV